MSEVSLGQSKKSQLLKLLTLLHTFYYLLETISCISFFSRPLIWTINSLIVITGLDKVLQNTEHDLKVKKTSKLAPAKVILKHNDHTVRFSIEVEYFPNINAINYFNVRSNTESP